MVTITITFIMHIITCMIQKCTINFMIPIFKNKLSKFVSLLWIMYFYKWGEYINVWLKYKKCKTFEFLFKFFNRLWCINMVRMMMH